MPISAAFKKERIDSSKILNDLKDTIKVRDNTIEEMKKSIHKMKNDFDQQKKDLNLKSVEVKEKSKLIESIKLKQEKKDISQG